MKSPYYEAGTRGLRSLVASLSETAAVLGKLRTNIIGLNLQLLDIWAKGWQRERKDNHRFYRPARQATDQARDLRRTISHLHAVAHALTPSMYAQVLLRTN